MNQQSFNTKGYALVEVLVAVVVLALIGGTGAYVYHRDHKVKSTMSTSHKSSTQTSGTNNSSSTQKTQSSTTPTTTPTPTSPYVGWESYTSADGVFSVKYPSNWSAGNPFGCGEVTCVAQVGFSPRPNTDVYIAESESDLSPESWFNQNLFPTPSDETEVNNTSINGYATYHDKLVDKAYTEEHYVLSHGGYILDIYFREIDTTFQPSGQTIASQQNNTQYITDFTKMVQSVAFKN
jgi:Tfp pilus assembly protein PilV